MVQYKLIYFDTTGLGEAIRLLFHYAGQKFEDVRITKDEWPAQKPKFFYGQLPVLEVDGKQLAQSDTILKFLGKKFGVAGKDEWEEAKASEIQDFTKDMIGELRTYFGVKMGLKEGDLAQVRKEVFVPAVDKYFPLYEKLLAQSGSGFMLSSGFSYVDLLVAQIIDWLAKMEPEVIAKHTKASQFMAKVLALPQLKEYMAKRKV